MSLHFVILSFYSRQVFVLGIGKIINNLIVLLFLPYRLYIFCKKHCRLNTLWSGINDIYHSLVIVKWGNNFPCIFFFFYKCIKWNCYYYLVALCFGSCSVVHFNFAQYSLWVFWTVLFYNLTVRHTPLHIANCVIVWYVYDFVIKNSGVTNNVFVHYFVLNFSFRVSIVFCPRLC